MTFGDFWVGRSKNTKNSWLFWFRGVHSWVFGCLGENGQDINLRKFLLFFLNNGILSKISLCRCRKHNIFPYVRDIPKIFRCTRFGGEVCTKMCFCWGHVGLVVLLYLCCFPHLALHPPGFCLFGFGFLGCFGVCVCVFLVWFRLFF